MTEPRAAARSVPSATSVVVPLPPSAATLRDELRQIRALLEPIDGRKV